MSTFQSPMSPWPALKPFARRLQLAGRELFLFDSVLETSLPPCLLVHGLGDEADTWRYVLPKLAVHRRVIALDLPGFGRSQLPTQTINVLTYTQSLLSLLDILHIPKVTLTGHSMGAIISQFFALSHPDRCADLVLVSGGLAASKKPLDLTLLLFLIPGIGELVYNNLRRDSKSAYQTLERYYHHLDSLTQADRDFLFERVNQRVWSDRQRIAFLSALRSLAGWLPAQQKRLPERLAACQIPTAILWGEQDQISPVYNGHFLSAMLPPEMTRLIMVDHCGHNLQQEKPENLLQILLGN